MRRVNQMIWKLLHTLRLDWTVDLRLPRRQSILYTEGWFGSYHARESMDREGNPIPWWTYACVDLLEPRLTPETRVFEYGCGNSTRWLSKRCRVTTVEHDREWMARIQPQVADSATIIHEELGPEYTNAVSHRGQFDIVVIDGRMREQCALPAIEALTDSGIIIWDDSERYEFDSCRDLFAQHGFKELPLSGLSPMSIHKSSTSILYRANNCLGI